MIIALKIEIRAKEHDLEVLLWFSDRADARKLLMLILLREKGLDF